MLVSMRLKSIAIVAGVLGFGASPTTAAAEFYTGKQISLFIATAAGGGYDAYARVIARHLGSHLTGNPVIVPKNMPGADGLILTNYLYNRSARDGTEIGAIHNGIAFEKLLQTLSKGGETARFESTEFGWIGSANKSTFVTIVWHTAPVQTLQDAQKTEAILGAASTASDNYLLAVLSNNLLGTKFKIVSGYSGSSSLDLAMEREEIHGAAGKDLTSITSGRPTWLSEKKIRILVQMGAAPHPDLTDVPFAIDLAKSPEDRDVMKLLFSKFGMARPYLAPPGLPNDRLTELRKAFNATLKDADLLAEATKAGMEINLVTGEEVERLVKQIMASPEPVVLKARKVLTP